MSREDETPDNEYRVSIRRTASTASYESVSIEVSHTFTADSNEEFGDKYKAVSRKLQRAVNHELEVYGSKAKKDAGEDKPRRVR